MDIYTAIARLFAESLAIGNGILAHLVSVPVNASGPLDPNITLTTSGADLVSDLWAAATMATSILSSMFGSLF
jgi:hypothetical protein